MCYCNNNVPCLLYTSEYISKDLRACAEFVAELDDKMLSLNEAIQSEALRKAEKPDSKKEE